MCKFFVSNDISPGLDEGISQHLAELHLRSRRQVCVVRFQLQSHSVHTLDPIHPQPQLHRPNRLKVRRSSLVEIPRGQRHLDDRELRHREVGPNRVKELPETGPVRGSQLRGNRVRFPLIPQHPGYGPQQPAGGFCACQQAVLFPRCHWTMLVPPWAAGTRATVTVPVFRGSTCRRRAVAKGIPGPMPSFESWAVKSRPRWRGSEALSQVSTGLSLMTESGMGGSDSGGTKPSQTPAPLTPPRPAMLLWPASKTVKVVPPPVEKLLLLMKKMMKIN
ncbi:leucine-rich repeat protein kinase family protein [Striga asiatica]|uniref:Leucine-rich repeat protein kinase family protein n=1 Tax=Striga asiatica TaxID=4170 RepID=A0A5A7QSU0_STRAF|nr:leucine-rich repeat protein kinase family protein [Striga asiatica]